MSEKRLEEILNRHKGDKEQIDFIQTNESCILTAPAGYGKTDSLISKIMYLIDSRGVYFPKKILVLTLSNVAKYTIEKRLKERIPNHQNIVDIYNFHVFATKILKKHGKSYPPEPIHYSYEYTHYNLKEDEKRKIEEDFQFIHNGSYENLISLLKENIKNLRIFRRISYEQVILLAILILEYGTKKIYHNIYPYIFVDEFQDVSKFQWYLIKALFAPVSQKIFCAGDEFQSIMKFADALGAEFIKQAETQFGVIKKIELQKNYRLQNKPNIDNFQRFIRGEQRQFLCDTTLKIDNFLTIQEEIDWIITSICDIKKNQPEATVCILVTGYNYFWDGKSNPQLNEYGRLFFQKIEDIFQGQYIDTTLVEKERSTSFYQGSLEFCAKNKILSFYSLKKYILEQFDGKPNLSNFLALIDGYREYCRVYNIDFTTIKNVLEKDELIKYAGYSKKYLIFISNIHKAKGAEWDYVFIPRLSPDFFPNFYSCRDCDFNQSNNGFYSCTSKQLTLSLDFYQLFYVAITRPREGLYISTSENPSCLFHHLKTDKT